MSSTDRKGGCCGFPTSHVATTVALVYFFILTVLAAVARRQVGVLEEAATAEGSDEAMWTNPLIVSLGCAILFALFDLACIALLWLLSRSHDEPTTALKVTWAGTVFLAVVWMTFCAVGSYLSFGSIKTEIEAACTTLDTHCYPTYEGIQWASIVLEVLGLLLAGWMLVSTGSTVHPGFFHKTPSASSHSGTHNSTPSRRKPRGDEEHGLLADGGASLRPTDSGGSAPYSLGRRSHSRSHGGSRRAALAEEYSMRKPRGRYEVDPRDRGRSRDRERTGSVARREIRRVQEEAERAVRSLGHARRVAERRAQEARKTASRSRSRGRRSSDEEREIRSMGKRGASRSRSRSRRSSSSEDSSSDDGRGRSRRSTSRGRSGSPRR